MGKRNSHKHSGGFPGKKGSGERFKHCVADVTRRGKVKSPNGVCAAIGRKKYGAGGMAHMSAAGRK
jgi:hypothetical protein